eukprot:4229118-Prorocentrum_lima.AAC.1
MAASSSSDPPAIQILSQVAHEHGNHRPTAVPGVEFTLAPHRGRLFLERGADSSSSCLVSSDTLERLLLPSSSGQWPL